MAAGSTGRIRTSRIRTNHCGVASSDSACRARAVGAPPRPRFLVWQVHVIEARDLVGKDLNKLSDPCVFVEAFGQRQRTSTKEKASAR